LAQALQFCVQRFVLALLLLTFCVVILPDPGVKRVFIAPKVTRGLGKGLIRLNG
jgi:hypothetical protein